MPVIVQDAADALVPDPGTVAPVLRLPLTLAGHSLATWPQGSPDELKQSVRLLMDTRPGERQTALGYGTPDLAFRRDVDPDELAGAVAEWEPRVTVTVTVDRSGPDPLVLVTVGPAAGDTNDDEEG